jgi:thioredoxin reductase (NADPH)
MEQTALSSKSGARPRSIARRRIPGVRLRPGETLDCLIIGGGPAGLTGAIYLARYRRNVLVIDDDASRAALIPESHNYPGFRGIGGPALLTRLKDQAREYGIELQQGRVTALRHDPRGTFAATAGGGEIFARSILLATGLIDDHPDMARVEEAIRAGVIRFCPVCDAYESIDRRIGVLGPAAAAGPKAVFLRTYSRHVTLFATDDAAAAPPDLIEGLGQAAVAVAGKPVAVERSTDGVDVACEDGRRHRLDALYPTLGCTIRSELAVRLGANATEMGNLLVDEHQRTSVPGLYAAGDVVSDLHQLSVAVGHAAIAATAIHNELERNLR